MKLTQGIEKTLVEDFLEFIDNEYPQLNPYTHFSICKDNKYLLTKRCIAIMERVGLGRVEYHRGWKHYIAYDNDAIRQIALSVSFNGDEWSVVLEMMPGDTMKQARNFYKSLQKSKIENLIDKGWKIEPNMHFSFRASNLVWTNVTIGIEAYIDYWVKNINKLGQVNRDQLYTYCQGLELAGIMSPEDLGDINTKILSTNMEKINICPGVHFSFSWTQKEAINLDQDDLFVDIVRQKICEAKGLWEPVSEER